MDPCRPGEALVGFEYCRMIFCSHFDEARIVSSISFMMIF